MTPFGNAVKPDCNKLNGI